MGRRKVKRKPEILLASPRFFYKDPSGKVYPAIDELGRDLTRLGLRINNESSDIDVRSYVARENYISTSGQAFTWVLVASQTNGLPGFKYVIHRPDGLKTKRGFEYDRDWKGLSAQVFIGNMDANPALLLFGGAMLGCRPAFGKARKTLRDFAGRFEPPADEDYRGYLASDCWTKFEVIPD